MSEEDEIKKALGMDNEINKALGGPSDEILKALGMDDGIKGMQALNQNLMRQFEVPVPRFDMPPVQPMPKMDGHLASGFHERLQKMVRDFENELDSDSEVGVRLVSFGQVLTFHLANIGYWNPLLITFEGETDNGEPVKLIQNVSQISILLMRLPRRVDPQRKPIGFRATELG